ncbi:LOW QUALITY PROTEIN: TRPM8 channel-associated factor 2-like [Sarcoramphus papa]
MSVGVIVLLVAMQSFLIPVMFSWLTLLLGYIFVHHSWIQVPPRTVEQHSCSQHPCELLVIGDEAFPVLVSANGQVLIAASCYGKGQMVVVSHEEILKDSRFSWFLRNAVEWLRPSPEALVGIHPHLDSLSQLLLRAGTKVQAGAELSPPLGVYCMDAYDSTQAKDLVGFVKAGGGLLIGGQAWHWASRHGKEKVLCEFPGNQVTSVAGVYFTGSEGETGTFSVSKEMLRIPLITQLLRNYREAWLMCSMLKCSTDDCLGRNFWLGLICSAMAHLAFFFHCVNSTAMGPLPEIVCCVDARSLRKILNTTDPRIEAQGTVLVTGHQPDVGDLRLLELRHFLFLSQVPESGDNSSGNFSQIRCAALPIHLERADGNLHHGIVEVGGDLWRMERQAGNRGQTELLEERVSELLDFLKAKSIGVVEAIAENVLRIEPPSVGGVTKFKIEDGSVPSHLLIHGALAFPIARNDSHQAFLAAAHYDRGHVVVLAHENFFQASAMKTFILNAIGWLDAGQGGQVGIAGDLQDFFTLLSQEKIPCKLTDLKENLSVYCYKAYSDEEVEIYEFVSRGGGLLVGGQKKEALKPPYSPWLKKLSQDSTVFLRIPAQTSLALCSVQEEMAELVLSQGVTDVSADSPVKGSSEEMVLINIIAAELCDNFPDKGHLDTKIQTFQKRFSISWWSDGEEFSKKLTWSFSYHKPLSTFFKLYSLTSVLKNDCPMQLDNRTSFGQNWAGLVWEPGIPMSSVTDDWPMWALQCFRECVESRSVIINGDIIPFPSFLSPHTFHIRLQNTPSLEWSYLSLSELQCFLVTNVPHQVQIGCHTDDLSYAAEVKRPPLVVKKLKVEKNTMQVSSLWGGLIYIIVPKESLYPAPWAELATENIILTVPAADVCHMDNPESLLSIWNKMMNAIARLAAIPATFPRPERMVADVQISHGWMHGGYPVMHHLESVTEMIDVQSLQANGLWGAIHELGHNQQQSEWEFPPRTAEAICNLWSVYVNETVLGIPRDKAHNALALKLRKRIQDYIENGAQLKDWEVFTALETYLQLQEAFGWEAFIEIFSEYQNMSQLPDSKMNVWAETSSWLVKKNWTPFFKAWGWPIKESLSQQLAVSFPSWSDDPLKQYVS